MRRKVRGALRRCSASDAERGEDRRRGIGHGVARGHLSSEPEKAHIGVKPVDDQRDDYRHEQQRDKNHQRNYAPLHRPQPPLVLGELLPRETQRVAAAVLHHCGHIAQQLALLLRYRLIRRALTAADLRRAALGEQNVRDRLHRIADAKAPILGAVGKDSLDGSRAL